VFAESRFADSIEVSFLPKPLAILPPCYYSRMSSLTAVGIILLALLIAAALYLMQQILKS